MLGVLGAGALASLTDMGLVEAHSSGICRQEGHSCNGNQTCCEDLTCEYSGRGNNKVCVAVTRSKMSLMTSCSPR